MEQVAIGQGLLGRLPGARWTLWAAVGSVALGFAALFGGIAAHVVGYALASLMAFTLVALFRRGAVERQVSAGVVVPHWMNMVAVAVLVVGFVVAVAQAWSIASYLS